MTCLQRNTNMNEVLAIEETGGRGRDPAPMTGKERESVATRANTTAVVDTQDIAVTDAETHTDRLAPGLIVTEVLSVYSNQIWHVL